MHSKRGSEKGGTVMECVESNLEAGEMSWQFRPHHILAEDPRSTPMPVPVGSWHP
ncbi:mCG1026205 [Mus musculus]|nr:mCG1026205 [Mus musculus]